MKFRHEEYDQLSVLSIRGELGRDESEKLRQLSKQLIGQSVRDFVLDLTETEFIDSTGLETLLWLQDSCAEQLGQIRLAGCQDHVQQILELTRLSGRFDRHADTDSAIKSLR